MTQEAERPDMLAEEAGEVDWPDRDLYECANQLEGYIDSATPDDLAAFLRREALVAAGLANTIVRMRRASTIPADHVVVPREPSEAMLRAVDWQIEGPEADWDDLRSLWSAMISAVPDAVDGEG
ncbi:hypothetical protein FPZ24_08055 [Sphingomonas panacisoli]|uniref:Uncharacterized protein n=1 Tax=Sphingomonas panacisoli TaxID=1813879 RepID=A0A5B8LHU4_9SPHN|nr:hypothetical protein [Sphingomonas panacisoli]QDZ07436.1 hypothetical protein FPZ24_08055 [Sphingomonas panacisoli]